MKLTQEQETIIKAIRNGERLVKINAFAGTGKTTTLVEIAKANPDKKILYLAFNRSIAEEAKGKFPDNVEVRTTHSLAYGYILGKHYGGSRKVRGDYRPYELAEILGIRDYAAIRSVKEAFDAYLNSSADDPDDIVPGMGGVIKDLFDAMDGGKIDLTHSFYLKKMELLLKNGDIRTKRYDIVMLDEAQDTNDVTLSIFQSLKARQKVVVGDRHQQIYSFRGSVNAMEKIPVDGYELTQSFRFTHAIAGQATQILKTLKEEKSKIKGIQSPSLKGDYAIVSRTNATLIEEILNAEDDWRTVRHPDAIFGLVRNIYKVAYGKEVSGEFAFLGRMAKEWKLQGEGEDFVKKLAEHAKSVDDVELETSASIALKYPKSTIDGAYEEALDRYGRSTAAKMYLTTAHTAKGLEWDEVFITEDFRTLHAAVADLVEKGYSPVEGADILETFRIAYANGDISQRAIEEINLFYVAVTRARNRVHDESDTISLMYDEEQLNDRMLTIYRAIAEEKSFPHNLGANEGKPEKKENRCAKPARSI